MQQCNVMNATNAINAMNTAANNSNDPQQSASNHASTPDAAEAFERHVYPVHDEAYWQTFENGVMERLASTDASAESINATHEHIHAEATSRISTSRSTTGFTQRFAQSYETLSTKSSTKLSTKLAAKSFASRSAAVAALLVLGIGIGFAGAALRERADTPFGSGTRTRIHATEASSDAAYSEAFDYLEASHLLLLGMMNLSGECGVHTSRSVQTLVSQRQCSRDLLLKTSLVKQRLASLPPSERREHVRSLVTHVEFALSEIAAIEPATLDAMRIEQLQLCSDNALCELNTQRSALAALRVVQ
jgi:hypothetical protein